MHSVQLAEYMQIIWTLRIITAAAIPLTVNPKSHFRPLLKFQHQLWCNNGEVNGKACSIGGMQMCVRTVIQYKQSVTTHNVGNSLAFGIPSIPRSLLWLLKSP